MLISLAFLFRNNMEYDMNRRNKSLGGRKKLAWVENTHVDLTLYSYEKNNYILLFFPSENIVNIWGRFYLATY